MWILPQKGKKISWFVFKRCCCTLTAILDGVPLPVSEVAVLIHRTLKIVVLGR